MPTDRRWKPAHLAAAAMSFAPYLLTRDYCPPLYMYGRYTHTRVIRRCVMAGNAGRFRGRGVYNARTPHGSLLERVIPTQPD